MANFLGSFPTYTQLPAIDGTHANVGDMAVTVDDGAFWCAAQPAGATPPVWDFVITMRGAPGPRGEAGVGLPGPTGQIGPPGARGSTGPQGPPGKNAFSNLAQGIQMPAVGAQPLLIHVTDTSWMRPGELVYIPGAGTLNLVGTPPDSSTVYVANSGDPSNAPTGTLIGAGNTISPASMRGPIGATGPTGPPGPQGPQGVSGTSAYTILTQTFTVPSTVGTAFVQNAAALSQGLVVYVNGGGYFSVTGVNPTNNSITLQNLQLPGNATIGTVIPVGATVSGTGPQGPQGIPGPVGPAGPQGLIGTQPTGVIFMYGAPTPPSGYLNCDGSAVSRTAYPNLFNIISTSYGAGDGSTTFNLPNLSGRFPIGLWPGGPYAANLNEAGGEQNHTLTIPELAVHAHAGVNHLHAFTGVDHLHSFTGVDHLHYDDHYHTIPAGQFYHGHGDSGHIHPMGVADANWSFADGGHAIQSVQRIAANNTGVGYAQIQPNTLPAGNSATKAGSGYGGYTGAADRSLAGMTAGVDRSLASVTGGADRDLTSGAIGSGNAHNNMPPYLTLNFIIKT